MTENEHFTGISTPKGPRLDWLAIATGSSALLLALGMILIGIASVAVTRAIVAHSVATENLNITLRQIHYLNEKKIAPLEGREPRLQPSESPFPE